MFNKMRLEKSKKNLNIFRYLYWGFNIAGAILILIAIIIGASNSVQWPASTFLGVLGLICIAFSNFFITFMFKDLIKMYVIHVFVKTKHWEFKWYLMLLFFNKWKSQLPKIEVVETAIQVKKPE
ncbi:hypothetical protein [Mycoplasmopsis alligatoris]|uniref:Uncharacterized protein n=1 Tax=Mycoplasmopsis alligatoris A21JP2 TaxID=747682 RepID=D4XVR2_9BACT|nr:hypothetical protein [Mycoplasmopsis alligatoris]EFF41565.1 hypothetical protein MALL_0090 [Mycoplasmopsis alligatoris A21JP2]